MKIAKHIAVKLADRAPGEVSHWRSLGFANRFTHECMAGRRVATAPNIATNPEA